jgi:ATP-dependent DNA helicase RecQ
MPAACAAVPCCWSRAGNRGQRFGDGHLIARGCLRTEGEHNTLEFTAKARDVLRGDVQMLLRQASAIPKRAKAGGRVTKPGRSSKDKPTPLPLDDEGPERFAA